ncbi:MAG: leucine-rich repeat domain-containing protein [Azonexaceae bacterium]|nr:leucine-rich repeat domain-containing protein [Azonexaceae bacterium]
MNRDTRSYWLQIRATEPKTIREPEQYDGADSISIACTQTDLPASAQSRLVQRWCEFLPSLGKVRRVWFRSQVPQRLFDAAASMPGLTDLWVKWSSIKSLEALLGAAHLTHLHLGGSAQIQSIAELGSLRQLKWLTLENLKRIHDLEPIAKLTQLEGFGFSGGIWGKPELDTLAPLAALGELKWLDLSSLKVRDGALRPLEKLRALSEINLPNYYALEEYAFLRARLPQLAADLEPYYSLSGFGLRCKKCRTESLLSLLGHGSKNLCPTCDAKALATHCQRYDALVQLSRNAGSIASEAH